MTPSESQRARALTLRRDLAGMAVIQLVLAVAVTILLAVMGYFVWRGSQLNAQQGPQTVETAPPGKPLGGKGYVQIDWLVTRGAPDALGRRMHLRIPREYKTRVSRYSDPEKYAPDHITHQGIMTVSIEAWLPDLTPKPAVPPPTEIISPEGREAMRRFLENRVWVELTVPHQPA